MRLSISIVSSWVLGLYVGSPVRRVDRDLGSGMKVPDKKSSRRMTALTIGCEASAFGMTDEIARPERAEGGPAARIIDERVRARAAWMCGRR